MEFKHTLDNLRFRHASTEYQVEAYLGFIYKSMNSGDNQGRNTARSCHEAFSQLGTRAKKVGTRNENDKIMRKDDTERARSMNRE